jgi:hypothetical protein
MVAMRYYFANILMVIFLVKVELAAKFDHDFSTSKPVPDNFMKSYRELIEIVAQAKI